MTIYFHLQVDSPPSPWIDVLFSNAPDVVFSSGTAIILSNFDGTRTVITGGDFGFGFDGLPTSGTISAISRTNADSTVAYESVTGLSLSLSDFWTAPDNRGRWSLAFSGPDTLVGFSGADYLIGGKQADAYFGGSGVDAVSYETATGALFADLGNPLNNTGDAAGDAYDSIEDLSGSEFADFLGGDANNNNIEGLDGDDVMMGRAGLDILFGGSGFDTVWYDGEAGGGGVIVNLIVGLARDTHGDFDLISVEGAVGAAGDDVFIGNSEDNQFRGLGGADYFDGGVGLDVVAYDIEVVESATGATIDLAAGFGVDAFGAVDIFIDIEHLIGTNASDALSGDAFSNLIGGGGGDDLLLGRDGGDFLNGGDGADTLVGGQGGDILIGGAGFDTLRYDSAESAVTVDLFSGVGLAGEAAGDLIAEIEGIIGSDHADFLFGDSAANVLIGGDGNDFIAGLDGDDIIFGGDRDDRLFGRAGSDFLAGGGGTDTFSMDGVDFIAPGVFETIYDFIDGEDVIELTNWNSTSLTLFESGGAVVITSSDFAFASGVVVLNATIAQVQDQVFVV